MIEKPFLFLLLLIPAFHFPEDYNHAQWFLGIVPISFIIAHYLYKKLSFILALFFFYTSLCVAWASSYLGEFHDLDEINRISVSMVASAGFLPVVLIGLGVLLLKKESLRTIEKYLPYYATLNSIYVLLGPILGINFNGGSLGFSGFIDVSGMNSCLIAVTILPIIPILLRNLKEPLMWFVIAINLTAIFISRGSIAYGVLAVGSLGYFIRSKKIHWALLAIVASLSIGLIAEGRELFDSAGRLEAYKIFTGAWWNSRYFWDGFGVGTFQMLGQAIQRRTGFMMRTDGTPWMWLWMHNDWLETLFQQGIIGFSLIVALALEVFFRLYKSDNKEMLSVALGLASCAIFDYPSRCYQTAFLIIFTIIYSLKKE